MMKNNLKNKKITQKNNRGITLIALVITIIVLLILAGISISMLSGDNSILKRAGEAKENTDSSGLKEQVQMSTLAALSNGNGQIKDEDLRAEIKKSISGVTDNDITGNEKNGWQVKVNNKAFAISNTGDVNEAYWEEVKDENGNVIEIKRIDGTVTGLKIGDTIGYNSLDGATTTEIQSSQSVNGYEDQTIKLSDYNGTWRLLGVENGKLNLISSVIAGVPKAEGDSTSNGVYTNSYFKLKGRTGYSNAESELNRICGFYGKGKYAEGARSINVDDINKITGYDPEHTGVNVNKAENILKQAFSENYCYQIKADTRQYKVIVVSNDQFRRNASNLDTLYFKGTGEELLPFKTIANVDEVLGPSSVNHVNNFNSVSIFFDLKPDYPIGSAENYIIEKAKEILPEGVNGGFEGEAKTFAETFKSLTILLVVAVFVMYVILGILYESYIHPLTVLSALPVAMVGGLLTLMVFKMELSLYAFIGLFMLLGIVKKNGILMIDFAIARQKEGMAKEKAVHTACLERFRPIMMTTLAALVGNIPLAVGWGADGSSRRPLGMAIVGGLVISQIITLFILPVIYLYFEDFQENILDKIPFFSRNIKNDIS